MRSVSIEELLIWAYRKQLVYELVGVHRDAARLGYGGDSAVACQVNGLLGATVDGGVWVGQANYDQVHDDAVAVHDAVASLDRDAAWLLIHHARDVEVGRPPLATGHVVRWVPVLTRVANDLSVVPVYSGQQNRRHKEPWFCPIRLLDDSERFIASRRTWREWWLALANLAALLRAEPARLTLWRVNDSMPPEAPWENETANKIKET